jgi:hypothetical protein
MKFHDGVNFFIRIFKHRGITTLLWKVPENLGRGHQFCFSWIKKNRLVRWCEIIVVELIWLQRKEIFFFFFFAFRFFVCVFYIGSFSHRDCRGACELHSAPCYQRTYYRVCSYGHGIIFLTADWILRRHKLLLCNVPLCNVKCKKKKRTFEARKEKEKIRRIKK